MSDEFMSEDEYVEHCVGAYVLVDMPTGTRVHLLDVLWDVSLWCAQEPEARSLCKRPCLDATLSTQDGPTCRNCIAALEERRAWFRSHYHTNPKSVLSAARARRRLGR